MIHPGAERDAADEERRLDSGLLRLRPIESLGSSLITIAVVACAITGLALLAGHNLPDPDFWWDEAGQFWMSQGQNHTSAFMTPTAPLVDGIQFGRNGYNLDPLGFTVILRFWASVFGTDAAALRALPFLFFVGTLLTAIWAARKVFRLSWPLAVAVPLFILGWYQTLQYATELRAYSVELMGVMALGALTVDYVARGRVVTLSLLMGSMAFFSIIGRYSVAIALGAVVLTIAACTLLGRRELRRGLVWTASTLLVVSGFLVWNIGIFGDGIIQVSPDYTGDLDLAGSWHLDVILSTLRENFLRPQQIPILGLVLLGLLTATWLMARGHHQSRRPRKGVHLINSPPWIPTLFFVALYEGGSILASALGLSPWNAAARWSIGLHSIGVLSAFGFLAGIREVFRCWDFDALKDLSARVSRIDPSGERRRILGIQRAARVTVRVTVAFVILSGSLAMSLSAMKAMALFQHTSYQPIAEILQSAQAQTSKSGAKTILLVEEGFWPSARMVWETDSAATLGIRPPSHAAPIPAPVDRAAVRKFVVDQGMPCGTDVLVVLVQPSATTPMQTLPLECGGLRLQLDSSQG